MLRLAILVIFSTACLAYVPNRKISVLPAPVPSAGRIVGGVETPIEAVPYQIALLYGGFFFCGGSIIKENVVVSAAHCVITTSPSVWSIRAGSSQHSNGGQVISALSVTNHESFNAWEVDYDIALFILSSDFTIGPSIAIVNLPTQGQTVTDGSLSIISGWGAIFEGGSVVSSLRSVEIPIVNQQICMNVYASEGWLITSRMICAGYLSGGGKDACQGDSGGPLVVNGELIGITSWGYGCARPGYPGVWSRVPFFVDWIISRW